jgi:hypothetical protein
MHRSYDVKELKDVAVQLVVYRGILLVGAVSNNRKGENYDGLQSMDRTAKC